MSRPQPPLHSTKSESAQDALTTTSTAPLLELRQNNPQDCANLIAASVDRATVEISRTIIALNATFSQQLQQASISASNGIKSAESSASSSISIVSQNASSATSSASFSLNLANLAVTSVNSALANANVALASAQSQALGVNLVLTSALSASTSDAIRLSSSLSSLEATLVSVKASASAAVALAAMSQQPLIPHGTAAIALTPMQLAGIVVGTLVASVFLSFTVGFLLIRVRSKEKTKASIKENPRDLKLPLSRSGVFPTGNSVVIKFSPPASIHDDEPISISLNTKLNSQKPSAPKFDEWPFTTSLDGYLDDTAHLFGPSTITSAPHEVRESNMTPHIAVIQHGDSSEDNMTVHKSRSVSFPSRAGQMALEDVQDGDSTINSASPPRKAGNGTFVQNRFVADVNSDLATKPAFTLKPMHRLPGDSGRAFEVVETSREGEEEPWTIRKHSPTSSCGVAAKELQQHILAVKAFEDPLPNHFVGLQESVVDRSSKDPVETPSEHPKPESDHSSPVVAKMQQPTEQGRITIKRDPSLYEGGTRSERVQDRQPPARGVDTWFHTVLTDKTPSPLGQNSLVGISEIEVELASQSPAAVETERELSPLRRNPPFQAISLLLAEQQRDSTKLTEEGVDEHESRGRSMLRTSDILEARISGLTQAIKSHNQTLQQRGGQAEPTDSRSISPVPRQQIRHHQNANRLPESDHHLTTDSLSLTSNTSFRSVSVVTAGVTEHRDTSSPLRQISPGIGLKPYTASEASVASGNAKEFSQVLSKFQTLASQTAQDAILASNEVTSRAIAGIYIPGSLREQAVRNLSKSRERGTGERRRKQTS